MTETGAAPDLPDEEERIEPAPPEAIAGLLEKVGELLDRYIVLPSAHARVALQLFIAHSHALDGAHATPYILIVSPEKRSGKSRLLGVLELAVARPWSLIGASEAAMFRKIAKARPTLLLDEVDAIFGSRSERTEPLRAILNAGNRPGASVARCVGQDKGVEDFPIFCAKVLAGIDNGHRIPETVRDRSVTIGMQRKTDAEAVKRFRHRIATAEAEPIREGLAAWGAGAAVELLLAADPELPAELDDRAAEAWEPLLAIAEMAGRDWPERARAAALALSAGGERDGLSIGAMALRAMREAMGNRCRIATTELLVAINADEELPFGGWRDGAGLDGRELARLLRPYGIAPRATRINGKVVKGYLRENLEEAWRRWLPDQAVTGLQADDRTTEISPKQAYVTDVTDGLGRDLNNRARDEELAGIDRVD